MGKEKTSWDARASATCLILTSAYHPAVDTSESRNLGSDRATLDIYLVHSPLVLPMVFWLCGLQGLDPFIVTA